MVENSKLNNILLIIIAAFALYHLFNSCINNKTTEHFYKGDPQCTGSNCLSL
jgi:hypothetical protein